MSHPRIPFILALLALCAAGVMLAQPAPAAQRVFYVRDFGATGDGHTLDTAAILRAIAAASAAGGGRIVLTPGIYLTGTIQLRSNITLDIEAGAVLLGSSNLADYAQAKPLGLGLKYAENSSGEVDPAGVVGIIFADNVENIAIVGQGVIDGNSAAFFDRKSPHWGHDFDAKYARNPEGFEAGVQRTDDGPIHYRPAGRPGTLVIFFHARNIVVRDVTFRNAPNWTFHMQHSQHAVINGLRIDNDVTVPNNDGIDCMDCRDVHVSDCSISTGDDDFAIVASEDFHVNNCTLVSRSAAIRLEDTRYATFSNLSIDANRGIGVFERGGGYTADILFSDIVMRTHLLWGHWWGKAEPIYIVSAGNSPKGGVRNVRFSNIIAESEAGILIDGTQQNPIRDVSFDRVKMMIRPPKPEVAKAMGGNFDLRWTAPTLETAVFKHDIPALYSRWANGLRIDSFEVAWQDALPDYFSNGITVEDFDGLEISGFHGSQAPAAEAEAAIVLRRGRSFSIRDSTATAGTGTFLRAEQATQPGLFVNNNLTQAKRGFAPARPAFTFSGNALPPMPTKAKR